MGGWVGSAEGLVEGSGEGSRDGATVLVGRCDGRSVGAGEAGCAVGL